MPRRSYESDYSSDSDTSTTDSESEQSVREYDSGDSEGRNLRNMTEYITVTNDSLPLLAERYGHSGEWQVLAQANPDIPDPHNILPGMTLNIPTEWISGSESTSPEE